MKQPNPYPAALMKPLDRRAELCRILALSLIRLHMRDSTQLSGETGESSLAPAPDQSGHATPTHRIAA